MGKSLHFGSQNFTFFQHFFDDFLFFFCGLFAPFFENFFAILVRRFMEVFLAFASPWAGSLPTCRSGCGPKRGMCGICFPQGPKGAATNTWKHQTQTVPKTGSSIVVTSKRLIAHPMPRARRPRVWRAQAVTSRALDRSAAHGFRFSHPAPLARAGPPHEFRNCTPVVG